MRDAYTFVTGFINLHDLEDRPTTKTMDEYMNHCLPLLTSGAPFVLFCHETYVDKIVQMLSSSNGSSSNVHIIPFSVGDLKHNTPDFFRATLPKMRYNEKDTHWYMATQLQKAYWLEQAARANPYHTTHYCWVDFGINHIMNKTPNDFARMLRVVPLTDTVTIGSQYFPSQGIPDRLEFFNKFHSVLLGGVIALPREQVKWFADTQEATVNRVLQTDKMVVWETTIWVLMVFDDPLRFSLYPAMFNESILTHIVHNHRLSVGKA